MSTKQDEHILYFVTHCDANYLSRAFLLRESLIANSSKGHLFIVCHDENTLKSAIKLGIPENSLVIIDLIIAKYPDLKEAKLNRSKIEYLFCLTPYILRYFLESIGLNEIVYIDADKAIFSDPEELFLRDLGPDLAITSHNFSRDLSYLDEFGKYNVGIIFVKRTDKAISVINWWAKKCLESTSIDGINPEVFGDQKYLDKFPSLLPETVIYGNPGINSAPWNCDSVIEVDNCIYREDSFSPLVTFHFSGLKYNRFFYIAGYNRYNRKLSHAQRTLVYNVYVRKLKTIDNKIGATKKLISFREFIRALIYRDIGIVPIRIK